LSLSWLRENTIGFSRVDQVRFGISQDWKEASSMYNKYLFLVLIRVASLRANTFLSSKVYSSLLFW